MATWPPAATETTRPVMQIALIALFTELVDEWPRQAEDRGQFAWCYPRFPTSNAKTIPEDKTVLSTPSSLRHSRSPTSSSTTSTPP
jgi:hypothetical protein